MTQLWLWNNVKVTESVMNSWSSGCNAITQSLTWTTFMVSEKIPIFRFLTSPDTSSIINMTYPLTARVIGAPQMISQPVCSIFPCSPLPSGTWRTPDLSIPWCCLPTSSSVCLGFFPLSLCLARWSWPDLMNGRHDRTTAVCVSLMTLMDKHIDCQFSTLLQGGVAYNYDGHCLSRIVSCTTTLAENRVYLQKCQLLPWKWITYKRTKSCTS